MRWVVIVAASLAGIGVILGVLHMKSVSEEAHEMVAGGAVLLDVRTPKEFSEGHLPGAINIPVDQVAGRASEIGPVTTAVVTYCLSGGRSARAAAALKQLGFAKVLNLGPKAAW
jgi:rhodanese-related sulfurtransferase